MVIDAVTQAYSMEYANVHRGLHYLSNLATEKYEAVRGIVARFLNAPSEEEIVFTTGATEGIGKAAVNYKLRDWLFSRQHFWGEPFPVLHDQYRNLLGRQTTFACRSPAMASGTGQLALALEGFEEIRFVGLDDIVQLGVLLLRRSLQQSMPPAKRRAQMNARAAGRSSKAATVNHCLRIISPRLTTFQPCQR